MTALSTPGEKTPEGFTPFACITIVGVGLMGGSLGHNVEVLDLAVSLGAIDAGETDLAEAVRDADGVVVAAPVGAIPALLEQIAPHAAPDALVTDLGSTKARIVEAGARLLGHRFVGGHPMAGSERSGVQAARPDLFAGAAWAVVRAAPASPEGEASTARLTDLVEALGARPIPLEAWLHDRLVALTSHLPHALSFAFARTVDAAPAAEQARVLAGGSYRDLMRVSAADPTLWHDILIDNRTAVLEALAAYETHLDNLKQALQTGDSPALLALLQGKGKREKGKEHRT